jgi:hypothetical protein
MRTILLLLLTLSLYSEEVATITLEEPKLVVKVNDWYDVASGKRFLVFYRPSHFSTAGEVYQIVEATPPMPTIPQSLDVESKVPVPEISRTYGPVPPGWFLVRTEGPVKIVQRLPVAANSVLTSPK